MSRSLLVGAALIGVAFAPQAPATAQSSNAIVVEAPQAPRAEPRNGVNQPRQYVAQVTVPTYDLDLESHYGRSLLQKRVELAAREVCARLDELEPVVGVGAYPGSESAECRLQAVRTAQNQVRAALWARG